MKPQTAPISAYGAGGPRGEVRAGEVLAGKYRVERVLGRGGMGQVLSATHLQLGQRVAIKMLLPEVASNPDIVARFSQEARATVKIQSEHVVRVLDVGALESGAPFMVMEYLDGSDLAQLVKQRGPLPVDEAVEYVLQACEALAEAHRAGIVHRDLKPANLFLTRRADGSAVVKVLDFGISKATLASGLGSSGLTQTSAVMGSPNYMSPEQLKNSKDVDARADIWSMGLVLYELLTGRVAFHAETLAELHVAILQSFPSPLRAVRPDAPPSLEMLVLRCLHKDPAYRFSNIAELARALGEVAPPRAQVSIERVCRVLGVDPRAPSAQAPQQVAASPGQQGYATGYAPPQPQPAQAPLRTPLPGSYAPPYGASYATPQPSWPGQQMPPPGLAPVPPWGSTSAPAPWQPPAQPVAAPNRGPSVALVLLIAIVAVVVVGAGGCFMCVLVGAASS